ncbi:MAG: hypothetical protein Q4D82_06870 [Neisseria sp.]|nr:hypothetical protein [Neisseria sp.]
MKQLGFSEKVRGFSLLEFLTAGVLGAAVLAAAGTAYWQARKLTVAADGRVSAQHLRFRLAEAVRRDFAQAGRFGCAALSDKSVSVSGGSGVTDFSDGLGKPGFAGIRQLAVADLGLNGFTAESPVLLAVYGSGAVAPERIIRTADGGLAAVVLPERNDFERGELLAVSDCATVVQTENTASAHDKTLHLPAWRGKVQADALRVMRVTAAAYVWGRPYGAEQSGLYRFERGAHDWGEPWLLAEAGGFQTAFAYCRSGKWFFTPRPEADGLPAWLMLNGAAAAVEGGRQCA